MPDTDPHTLPDQQRLAAWIRLEQTPGVGGETARRLLAQFGSPQQIFNAEYAALRLCAPVAAARALSQPVAAGVAERIALSLDWLARPGHRLLTLHDRDYPALLAQIPDPPPLLYACGRIELLAAPALAIVGSRNATAQGKANAELFAHALSLAGLTIVSGLALGIDGAAHRGGLAGPGSTVAVIGSGPDSVYPASHRALAERIGADGCIVSEYAPGTPPLASNFPRRNRIISGLAAGVLVVEAAARSGSLITAQLAAAQGREVFAIPGSIHAALAKGCHALIRDGAQLVESAADVLGQLRLSPLATGAPANCARAPAAPAGPHPALLEAIGYDPVHADVLATRSASAPGELGAALLALELAGQVERLPGGLFQRIKP